MLSEEIKQNYLRGSIIIRECRKSRKENKYNRKQLETW